MSCVLAATLNDQLHEEKKRKNKVLNIGVVSKYCIHIHFIIRVVLTLATVHVPCLQNFKINFRTECLDMSL